MGFLAPIQLAASARTGLIIPRGLQTGGQNLFARLGDGHRRGMYHGGHGLRRLLFIRQEQRMCPAHGAGGALPCWMRA